MAAAPSPGPPGIRGSLFERVQRQPTRPRAIGCAHMRSARSSICWRRGRNLTLPSAPSTPASPRMPDTSILISPTSAGCCRHMAGQPPSRRLAAASAGGIDRSALAAPQLLQSKRFCLGGGLAVGNAATRGPIHCWRYPGSKLCQDGSVKNAQGPNRSQCRSCEGAATRGTRADDCGQQQICAGTITSPACPLGFLMRSVGSRPAVVSRCGSSNTDDDEVLFHPTQNLTSTPGLKAAMYRFVVWGSTAAACATARPC